MKKPIVYGTIYVLLAGKAPRAFVDSCLLSSAPLKINGFLKFVQEQGLTREEFVASGNSFEFHGIDNKIRVYDVINLKFQEPIEGHKANPKELS